MIAFQIEILRELTKDGTRPLSQVNLDSAKLQDFMQIEFLGARLSSCSSIQYLGGDGYVYYASNTGDSYILQVLSNKDTSEKSD